jgi:1,4-dihydroxy-2-naphthoate octaprenyltransferase
MGTAMAIESDAFHLWSALAALVGAVFIQIGTNLANDYFDFKKGADRSGRIGPTRVTQAGLVSPNVVRNATVIAFALAFLTGIYLVYRAGWPIVAIGLFSILFGVLYTAGPFALAYNGLADFFVLIFFGPVAVGGTYYVQTLTITWPVIVVGLAPGLVSVAILTANNLRDIKSDAFAGRKTLAVRFGPGFAKAEYVSSIFVATIIPFIIWRTAGTHPFGSLTLLILAAAIPSFEKVFTYRDDRELIGVLESTGQLLLLYSVIFSVGWLL